VTAMVRFAPVPLPETMTLRRSSLASLLRVKVNYFARLLAEVAPHLYTRTAQAAPLTINGTQFHTWNYYVALVNWCSDKFPVWIPDYLQEEFEDDQIMMEALADVGIPVEPVGVRDDELYHGWSATLGIVAYLLQQPVQRESIGKMMTNHVGEAWTKLERVQPYLDRQIDDRFAQPPRGRQWTGRWQNLPWLIQFVQHDTGYQFLDVTEDEMDEGGNPPWSKDDIEFLSRDWATTQRVWKPLREFIQWLDSNPNGYMPTLIAALTGDDAVRRQISQPKRTKTLAEVFDAQDKQAQRARIRAR